MRQRFYGRKMAGIIVMVILGVFVFGSFVMLLWNALMPVIFHLPVISFEQALGLLVLAKIFFGGFRGGPRMMWKRDNLRQAWHNMSPEQREKFKHNWERRCGRPFDDGRVAAEESAPKAQ